MITTLPTAVWRTPDDWSFDAVFCTWVEICRIASELDADPYQAEQFMLVGAPDRALPRGWYQRAGYDTADGKHVWTMHCVELTSACGFIRESFIREPKPAAVTDAAERSMLIRCLTHA